MRAAVLVLLLGCECLSPAQIHLPGKRPQTQSQTQESNSSGKTVVDKKGTVNSTDNGSITIEAADSRFLSFKVVPSTKFNDGLAMSNIKAGERVRITGTQDDESFLTATAVYLDDTPSPVDQPTRTAATATAREVPHTEPMMRPAPRDPDDQGPPHLKYGKPDEQKAASSSGHTVQYDATPYVPPPIVAGRVIETASGREPINDKPLDPKAALVERAREEALNFTDTLPNYVCQQFTTRYMRGPGSNGWQAQDIVSATVVYEGGKEDYRNIQINGKAISKKMEEMQGSWSTGEFATTLRSLFHPGRFADFHYVKQTTMNGMTAWVYDYKVLRQNSDWRIQLGSQSIIPAYSGRVWIDSKTARTLRIEMSADNIPEDFPLDKVEATDDYGFVRLSSAAEEYLLPTHAENLSCERGTTICSRNAIDFRNYHKYSGEAVITFDK